MPTVLLVEDNEWNREMLARRLERHGWSVSVAGDGPQCLELAAHQHFNLILMDMTLPGKDGWQITRELKDDVRSRDIPVIALTAHAMGGDRERAFSAGCDEFETKPIDFASLTEKMTRLTKSHAMS